jgi:beta-lactam-binding protein with PASTA domain
VKAQPGEIPDVSGRDVVEAARKLSRAGYDVAAIQTVKSEVEAGTTLKTQPAAGTSAEPGTPVFLVTSGGPSGQAGD